ncbi:hypothetical protein VOI32_37595 [Paraburkholderia caribensis]|uniref:Uncharacterized protein n=1 Tax=Paraburkholderia caribensis TaxID=75105 RepID=A0ABV0E838_9BURK|nr:hypothetical protein [Paraburkholderia caribensis]
MEQVGERTQHVERRGGPGDIGKEIGPVDGNQSARLVWKKQQEMWSASALSMADDL